MDTFDENEEKNESNVMSLSYDRQIHVIAGYNNIIYKKDENAFKKVNIFKKKLFQNRLWLNFNSKFKC